MLSRELAGRGVFGDQGDAGDRDEFERIEAGGIPLRADARLAELAGPGSLFTSTLGVAEFALLSELECVPLGQVLGASVHQVGWQYLAADAQWGGEVFCELDSVGGAWNEARRRALIASPRKRSSSSPSAPPSFRSTTNTRSSPPRP